MKLNIITPLSRGENFWILGNSIEKAHSLNNYKLPIKWWVVIDPSCSPIDMTVDFVSLFPFVEIISTTELAPAGHKHRNLILNLLESSRGEEYFYSLDDDNIIFPDLFNIVYDNLAYDGIIGSQLLKGDTLRLKADPNNIRLNHIDTAQFIFKLKLLKGLRFEDRYDADGVFIEKLYADNRSSFIVLDQPICYYNYLR